ncbi:MAG: class I SAM-dependent rRNA methyltransferase [Lachnospiraceae bacterium]|nr:class I SAM-dependent rRNA methyltransferase [Lachnospiraceae bacterium]
MANQTYTSEGVVHLIKGEGRLLKSGGSWVFDNEVEQVTGTFENGDVVRVEDFDGYFMGWGVINLDSKIRVRMLCRHRREVIDDRFLEERVRAAYDYRKEVIDTSSCRLIFGEAVFLPGLVVDKYEDLLVVQSLSLGMDRLKKSILTSLIHVLQEDGVSLRGIYERSDAKVRKKEGMTPFKGWIWTGKEGWIQQPFNDMLRQWKSGEEETFPQPAEDVHVSITENGVSYLVDVENGQKTGFFLDQKQNRMEIQKLAKGKKVLDCFTHMGTFALNAGLGGASSVLGLDISELAVAQATENARRNHLSEVVTFRAADVLDELPKLYQAGESYDLLILDPPAFTKSRTATKQAIKGYREINRQGIRLVKDGGYFATCSCSHFMTEELFKKTVKEAADSVHVRLRQIQFRTQAADHPMIWGGDDSYYLKFMIFQVVREK